MATGFSRKRNILLAAIGILVLGGGAWGVVSLSRGHKSAVPKELTVEALKAQKDPGKVFDQVHQAMNRTDLTEQQRHAVWANARTVMEARMDERMNEYFNASASQRKAILDRHLDEMQARMKEFEQRRAQHEQERGGQGAGQRGPGGSSAAGSGQAGAGGPNSGPGARDGRGWGDHRGGSQGQPTREQRKEHSESRDPDQRARHMAYFTAMRQRAEERGIQMPFGPRGGGPH